MGVLTERLIRRESSQLMMNSKVKRELMTEQILKLQKIIANKMMMNHFPG